MDRGVSSCVACLQVNHGVTLWSEDIRAGLHDNVPADLLPRWQKVCQSCATQLRCTDVPDWVTISAVQPTFWDSDSFNFKWHGHKLAPNRTNLGERLIWDIPADIAYTWSWEVLLYDAVWSIHEVKKGWKTIPGRIVRKSVLLRGTLHWALSAINVQAHRSLLLAN